MKNSIFKSLSLVALSIILLNSCTNSFETKYKGKWFDKKTETQSFQIEKSGSNFILSSLQGDKASFAAKKVDEMLEISGPRGISRAMINEEGELIYDGISFVKEENSLKFGLPGSWELTGYNKKIEIHYDSKNGFEITFPPKDNARNFNAFISNGLLVLKFEDDYNYWSYTFSMDPSSKDKGFCSESFDQKGGGRAITGGRGHMRKI